MSEPDNQPDNQPEAIMGSLAIAKALMVQYGHLAVGIVYFMALWFCIVEPQLARVQVMNEDRRQLMEELHGIVDSLKDTTKNLRQTVEIQDRMLIRAEKAIP